MPGALSTVILRKCRPSQSEGLPTKGLPRACPGDLCTSTAGSGPSLTEEQGVLEIESRWIAHHREQRGMYPAIRHRDVT
jgi:hypothetical protein